MECRLKLRKDDEAKAVDPSPYRSIIESLRYLVHTRPDIAHFVGILPKLSLTNHATHLHRLNKDDYTGGERRLVGVDMFVSAADTAREPPLATANTVLSVLAADYPAGMLACCVSNDGAGMLLFKALFETARLARRWVPFSRRHIIEPRAPEPYFARNVGYLRDKVALSFVKERHTMKREYEEFTVRMNYLAAKTRKVPEEGWLHCITRSHECDVRLVVPMGEQVRPSD
ncbi:putative cellulose synthase A catalytic subunit 11 [UDP-forming] [Triticum urartu]|uniref:putative cellulose synthase A catalytic subunit 11 [UDP-forming] n=1 Tax=Triticum urartu TaxID=4572 RepID=UPI002043D163|nr:putative cellulose synthase A catalytic subunit 11 [UDP-forming] [Triticum urartu]